MSGVNESTSTSPQRRFSASDVFIWTGVGLFCIGLIAVIVTFAVAMQPPASTVFYFLALAAPLGLVFGVIGALLSGRRVR